MSAELDQLAAQQSLLTDGLKHMVEGHWVGFPSLEGDINALSPGIQLAPHPPVLQSEAGPEPPKYAWNPHEPQIGQLSDWSCSACSTEYVERAAGASRGSDVYANREAVVNAIGYSGNINEVYGLMDGSGAQLQRVLREHAGIETHQGWLDFDTAYAIFSQTFGLGSGGAYYHWIACRGVQGSDLWIANSAIGYRGVYETLSRQQFNELGPWSMLWAV